MTETGFQSFSKDYLSRLKRALDLIPAEPLEVLAHALMTAWRDKKQVFIFGNGGSAGNAIHLANDFLYGISKQLGHALRVSALTANPAVITCLANDTGYANIYAHQLQVKGRPGDLLIVLSGSGNSANVVQALETANALGLKTFAILAYSGGRCRELAEVPIHFAIDDMQIAEDTQLVVGHLCMQWLNSNKPTELRPLR